MGPRVDGRVECGDDEIVARGHPQPGGRSADLLGRGLGGQDLGGSDHDRLDEQRAVATAGEVQDDPGWLGR